MERQESEITTSFVLQASEMWPLTNHLLTEDGLCSFTQREQDGILCHPAPPPPIFTHLHPLSKDIGGENTGFFSRRVG